MICKKFQIPCPAEIAFLVNETVNGSLAQPAAFVGFNRTESDSCQPRYFIFNSQVTINYVQRKILGKKTGTISHWKFSHSQGKGR